MFRESSVPMTMRTKKYTSLMSFDITDNGEFVDGIYITKAASYVYSMLIGRKTHPLQSKKNDFTEADVIHKGYLNKEGSWVKSWKKRYFVLRSDIRELCYYPSKEDMTLIGSIKIDENTCVWTNKNESDHNFVLSWTPPKKSNLDKREIRLRADCLQSKTIWMEQIAAEASRTKDVVLKDWWVDLFGDIFYQRKGDEIESRKRATSVLRAMKKFSLVPPTSPYPTPTADGAKGVNLLEGISEDEDNVSPSPARSGAAEDDMDARAEQLALRVLNKIRDRRSKAGGVTSMSGLFAGVDEAVDEMASDYSDVEEEDMEEGIDHKQIVEKIAVEEEEDNDEDFVFSRGANIVAHEKGTRGGREQTLSKDSDDDSDTEELRKRPVSTREVRDKRKSGNSTTKPRVVKEKKEKKFSPPPLPETNANRFDVDGETMKGLCISVELSHVLEGDERIHCSLSSANLNESAEWKLVCHTESYKVEEEKLSSHSAVNVHRVAHQFQLLQDPAFLKESTHILVILYKMTKGQKKKGEEKNTPICSGIVRCDELLSTGGITQVKMTISADELEVAAPRISKQESSYNSAISSDSKEDSSKVVPTANLGVMVLSSALIYQRRMKLTSDMKCRPYAENMFCFRTIAGENLVLEQLFASRYSLSVAKAMLDLIVPERKSLLRDTKKTVKQDLKKAISSLKNIPSKAALQELDDMLTGGGQLDGKNTIETVSRAEALQRTKNLIKDIYDTMIENYQDCEEHCTQALAGETFPGMVITPDVGGSQLRRSVWKKSPVWQFCTTNLNVNVMTWRSFSDSELKSEAHVDLSIPHLRASTTTTAVAAAAAAASSPEAKLSTVATVTFGVPAAHSFGFHDGGLRRLMAGLGPHEETRVEWMCLLHASGGVSMDLLKKSSGDRSKQFRDLFDVHVDLVTGDGWTAAFQKATKLAMRIDACVSQALGFALASIKTVLTLATYGETHQINCLGNAFAVGNFLLPVESFLSTQGHEMGMIEDLEAAVLWLSSVKIRLVTSYNCNKSTTRGVFVGLCDDVCIRRHDKTGRLVVDLEMNREEIALIKKVLTGRSAPAVSLEHVTVSTDQSGAIVGNSDGVIVQEKASLPSSLPSSASVGHTAESAKQGDSLEVLTEFGLTGVVFTCGVNEMQSLVNLSGGKEAHKQNEINLESFQRLSKYLMLSAKAPSGHNSQHHDKLRVHNIELKVTLDAAQASPHVKTPGVLIKSAKVCREVCGTVGILCKSGKDRTSMGVTLEQSCMLAGKDDPVLYGQGSTRVMRKYGVRRMNVYANTGQGNYAFNSFQQGLLPKCYRPPGGTFGGNVAS